MPALHVTLLVLSLIGIARAGNTTCKTTSMDWFTKSVGETPCRMYERLRQNCSPTYQVPSMPLNIPTDICNDQPSSCCCNSIAFALQMLCLNCQYGTGSGTDADPGYDAPAGAYNAYLHGCGPVTNKTLPNITQTAVCKQNINIPQYLYDLFWDDGAWFNRYTQGVAQLQVQSGKNETGLCPKTATSSSLSTTATATGSSTPSASAIPSQSSTNVGAIAGGVVGGVVLLALAVLAGFFVARGRKKRGIIDLTEDDAPDVTLEPYHDPSGGTSQNMSSSPFIAPNPTGWTYPDASGSASTPVVPPSRHYKPGQITANPPTRAEIHESRPLLSPPGLERHEDSEALSGAYGLGRSPSGRLPPEYEAR